MLFTDTLESKIDIMRNTIGMKGFKLHVHPYVAAFIKQGIFSLYRKWQMRYGMGLRVIPDQKLAYLEYRFYDKNGNEVDMTEKSEMKN